MFFYYLVYSALILTTPFNPRKIAGKPIVSVIDKGYVIDFDQTYYHVSRDGRELYYRNANDWVQCGNTDHPNIAYAYDKMVNKVWKVEITDSISFLSLSLTDISTNCYNEGETGTLLYNIPTDMNIEIIKTRAAVISQNLQIMVEIDVTSTATTTVGLPNLPERKVLLFTRPSLNSDDPFNYNMQAGWFNLYLSSIQHATVIDHNSFLVLLSDGKLYKYAASNTMSNSPSLDDLFEAAQSTPEDKGEYRCDTCSNSPVPYNEFPSFDYHATSLTKQFQYWDNSDVKAVTYDFDTFTVSFITSSISTNGLTRYHYKNNFVDTSIGDGAVVKLLTPQEQYYSTSKPSSIVSESTSGYYRNGELFLTAGDSSFQLLSDYHNFQGADFEGYYIENAEIYPRCMAGASSLNISSFQLNPALVNEIATAHFKMVKDNSNTIARFYYVVNDNDKPDINIPFPSTYTYNGSRSRYQQEVVAMLTSWAYNDGYTTLNMSTFFTKYNNAEFASKELKLTSNCRNATFSNITFDRPTGMLRHVIDANLYNNNLYEYTFKFSTTGSTCNDLITHESRPAYMFATNDVDYYLMYPNLGYGYDIPNSKLLITMKEKTLDSYKYYKENGFNIDVKVEGKRCGSNFIVGNADYNDQLNRLEVSLDNRSLTIKTSYTMTISINNNNINNPRICEFSYQRFFDYGEKYFTLANWIQSYEMSPMGNKLNISSTSEFNGYMNDNFYQMQRGNEANLNAMAYTMPGVGFKIDFDGCQEPVSIDFRDPSYHPTDRAYFLVDIPMEYQNTTFHFKTNVTAIVNRCYINSVDTVFKTTQGSPFVHQGLVGLSFGQSPLLFTENQLKLDFKTSINIYNMVSRYITREFTIQLNITGITFPVRQFSELVTLNAGNFVNGVYVIANRDALEFDPCQRSFRLEMTISKPNVCQMNPYSVDMNYGNGEFTLPSNDILKMINDKPDLLFTSNNEVELSLSEDAQGFAGSNVTVNLTLKAKSCSISMNSIYTMGPRVWQQQELQNHKLLFGNLNPNYINKYSQFSLSFQGLADQCKIKGSEYVFNAGIDKSVDGVLNGTVIDQNEIVFQNNQMQIKDTSYNTQMNLYSTLSYQINKVLLVDSCQISIIADTNGNFNIPLDYYNNTASYQLRTTVTSSDCQLQTMHKFSVGNAPEIHASYYNFGQIEIIGKHLGDINSQCKRERSVVYTYFNGTVANKPAQILYWVDDKAIVKGDFDVQSISITVGNYTFVSFVVQPYFQINSFMNNDINEYGKQRFEMKLKLNGLNETDEWEIHPKNTLYSSFVRTRVLVSEFLVLELPQDKIANEISIYFTVGPFKIPGLIVLTIKRIPVFNGQSLTPLIQQTLNSYEFSFRLPNIVKFSLQEFPLIENTFTLDPAHVELRYDAPNILSRTPASYIVNSYELKYKFKVESEAVVGKTYLNNKPSGELITIGAFTNTNNERVAIENLELKWIFNTTNQKVIKVGEFPLMVNISLSDSKFSSSFASFSAVASLVCKSGEYPNVFGKKNSVGNIDLCSACPDGAECFAAGDQAPKRKDGYYRIEESGAYSFQQCYPAEACTGESQCTPGYGNYNLYRWNSLW